MSLDYKFKKKKSEERTPQKSDTRNVNSLRIMDLMADGVFQEHKLGINLLDSCGERMKHFVLQTDKTSRKGL